MEDQDYPARHFRLMVKLAEDLRTLPAQIVEHAYHGYAFGSWWTTLQRRGKTFRIVFDGKERQVRLERASTAAKPEQWEELCSLPTTDHDGAQVIPEVVARLRAV